MVGSSSLPLVTKQTPRKDGVFVLLKDSNHRYIDKKATTYFQDISKTYLNSLSIDI